MKEHFLLNPGITFLNHGSFGATPKVVFHSYQQWQRELENEPVAFLGRWARDLLAGSRSTLADYLGTKRDNLVYTTNVTVALNMIARSINLGPGDEVLSTNMEYGALDRTWKYLSAKRGFKYITQPVSLPFSEEKFLDEFLDHIAPATRIIFLSHISSPTAIIFPVKKVCEIARSRKIITIIDGAHAPGQIDLNLDEIGADFYGGNLHKWLCAPKGAGFLYAADTSQSLVEPLVVSWGWQSDNPGPSQFVDIAEWTGTRDISAFLSVSEAIDFQYKHDWKAVRARCHDLATTCIKSVSEITGLPDYYPDTGSGYAQMASCPLPDSLDISYVQSALFTEFHIEVPLIAWNGLKLIRFSFQGYNDENDVLALTNSLRQILSSSGRSSG